jgi:hypothetical protein
MKKSKSRQKDCWERCCSTALRPIPRKRLARKNGGALGSATYNPPTNGTSEHVQTSIEGQTALPQPEQAIIPTATTKRFRWTERKMGDLTELVIMDGKKVHDFYPLDAIQEVQAVIEKLNSEAGAGAPGTAMAAD